MIDHLRELGFQRTLASIYNHPFKISALFIRAGLPRERMPALVGVDSLTFWEMVVGQADDLLEGGLSRLARAAAADYPGNAVLREAVAYLSGQAEHGVPFTILFLASNPKRDLMLRTDAELKVISTIAERNPAIRLLTRTAVWIEELTGILAETRPNMIHFSGHGSRVEDGLVFENREGEERVWRKNVLTDMVRGISSGKNQPVRFALLNACDSDATAQSLAACIGAAIGFAGPINDREPIAFTRGFYQGLVNGLSLKKAAELGCSQIRVEGPSGRVPVIKIHERKDLDPEDLVLIPATSGQHHG